ncbi:MAG TPA: type III-A CRISPR-associated protein Cas10/Csm1 [Aquifex aeolicus]|nr:type III-A CRISPR-associated protein Cas10/Csm1 [Aquifex aeolicus]
MGRLLKGERILIALGGLLHDIGKFYQRAYEEEGKYYERREDTDNFGYAHAQLSYEKAREILDKLRIENEEDKEIVLSACFHHKPDSKYPEAPEKLFPVRAIFRLADWYASTERSVLSDIETKKEFKRLRSVFEIINIGKGKTLKNWFYKLSPLKIDEEVIFPKVYEEATDYRGIEKEYFYGKYLDLKKGFEEALNVEKDLSLEERLTYFYYVLYKYTWCVPASIYDVERYHSHYPDISLFDHSRVVSALATALYIQENLEVLENYNDKAREKFAKKLRLVIFEGDISGIQRFLYDISNIKGAAKRLRGRSSFITFLPEIVGRFILKELGYPWTNLLYVGGGKFQAVVGYEEGIEEKLKEIGEMVEESLLREFGGKLGLVLYHTTFNLSQIKDYSGIIRNLMNKAERAKKRKFIYSIEKYERIANKPVEGNVKLCPSCRWELIPEKEEICSWCKTFTKVGNEIPKSKYVILSDKKLNYKGFYLKGVGGVYFAEEIKDYQNGEVFLINDTERFEKEEKVCGFKFIGKTVPLKDDKEDIVKPFEELVEEAEGDKKLAYVMADVDNLGLIFMKGLGEHYTISRVATLSRSLDLFFSGYLNYLFSKEFDNKIYIVYAGGDDLFIVAPWNYAIEAIQEVRKEFKFYTCENPNIGMSCGVFTCTGNYPIRLASEGVSKAEKNAKENEGKDSINVLGETLKWSELEKALESADEVINLIRNEIGRGNLYRFYQLLRNYFKADKSEEKYMFYPLFYYYLIRNIKKAENRRAIEALFLDVEKDYKVKDSALFIAKYLLMRTRDVRKGNKKLLINR